MKGIGSFPLVMRCVACCAALLLFASVSAGQDEHQQERAKKLDQCARSIEQIKIDKATKPVSRTSDGRQYSKASELHVLFQACASGAENDNKDGALVFGIQCSGFTSVVDPRAGGGSVKDAGSDVVRGKVTIAGLMDKNVKRPKADIDIPRMNHGSTYPAVQLARDEVARRVKFFFPDVDIEGMQRFDEKHLEVENQGEEPINVWIFYRTREQNEQGYQWHWRPGEPGGEQALRLSVDAGKTVRVEQDGEPIRASRVRIWAESESGEGWEKDRRQDLFLIKPNRDLDGVRAYHAEEMQTYKYPIEPSNEPRVFVERVITLRNDAPEELQINLSYYTSAQGASGWRSATVVLQPGQSEPLRGGDGMRLRASRLRFYAESENRRYEKYADETLYTVKKTGDRRAYRSKKIGEFVHVFDAAGETRDATVIADNAPIQQGSKTVASTSRDQSYQVVEERGDWVRVKYRQGGEDKDGWMQKKFVDFSRTDPRTPPNTTLPIFRVRRDSTDVKLGNRSIARLSQGDNYDVLEEKDGWLRVQVSVDGLPMQGWVSRQDVDVQQP